MRLSQLRSWRWSPRLGRHVMTVFGLLLVALMAVVQVLSEQSPSHRSALNRLDLLLYDWRFQVFSPQRDHHIPIVIVDLDEATQQREGRWPWDRAKVADLLEAIRHHGAALTGFDVVFSEKTSNAIEQLMASDSISADLKSNLAPVAEQFDGDRIFAESLGFDTVLGFFFHADGASVGALPFPFFEWPEDEPPPQLINLPDYTANLEVLNENAPFSGFVVAIPDADGVVRRMPLVMRYGSGIYASLGLEMARLALDQPWLRLQFSNNNARDTITAVQIGQAVQVPVDTKGNMLVPYRGGARSFPTLSATQVLRGDATEEELAKLKGALVLVGTSALGLADLRTIPLQTGYPGVEAHANVLDTILQGALGFDVFYYQPDWEPGATLLLLIVSGAFLAFYLPRRTPPTMIVVSLAWLLLVLGSNAAVWWHWHLALPLALPVITVVALALLNIIAGFLITNRQKHAIQNLFGEYVPPAYVERMVANPTVLSLEGEQREMTVLFADVRNFTALSESLSATELKDVLNRYLSAITQVIFEHQGTIDKYVGDLVMAFWNAPLDDPDHAKHAVEAALAMQKRMVALRDEFAAEGLPEFHIGIGLNTGTMNVGDMGSRYRRAYTVLGDSVNLASRLESLCPFYGVPILVSEQTRQANPEFLYLPIDLVRVKGRREAVELFQPLSFSEHASEIQRKQVAGVETFLRYYRSKQWQQAQEQLATLLQNDPNNNAFYAVYKARLAHILASKQTPADFPVFSHEQK